MQIQCDWVDIGAKPTLSQTAGFKKTQFKLATSTILLCIPRIDTTRITYYTYTRPIVDDENNPLTMRVMYGPQTPRMSGRI